MKLPTLKAWLADDETDDERVVTIIAVEDLFEASAMEGGGHVQTSWPRYDDPVDALVALDERLERLGNDIDGVD